MASNFSSIGIVFASEEDYLASLRRMLDETSEAIEAPEGLIAVWTSATGAQVYIHLEVTAGDDGAAPGHNFVGLTPFYSGASDVEVRLTAVFKRPDDNAFEGGAQGWAAPDDETGEGLHPIVVDPVDWPMIASASLPLAARLQVCCFAQELLAYADEAAFRAASMSRETPGLSERAFIPIGLFANAIAANDNSGSTSATRPSSVSLVTGRILEHRALTSEGGLPFYWLLVETISGAYDVVADPQIVQGEIVDGGTIAVTGTLFSRVVAVAEPAA